MNLKLLTENIQKFLYLEDTKIIDLVLAIMLSREQTFCKIWVFIVGASGDGKTELLQLLEDEYTTKVLTKLTPNTLVNGRGNHHKIMCPDLAPKLRNKVVLFPEMAQMISLHPDSMRDVWAQLRDLYDGKAGKSSGDGADILYTNLNVTLIGCATSIIESRTLVHRNLGTRELIYNDSNKNENKLMDRIVYNNTLDTQPIIKDLQNKIQLFISTRPYQNKTIEPSQLAIIKKWAVALTILRASTEINYQTGELLAEIKPEKPTRILKQFMTLYLSLKSLEKDYSDKRAMAIIQRVTLSSTPTNRKLVLQTIIETQLQQPKPLSSREVGKKINIAKNTAYAELNTLTALGILQREEYCVNEERQLFYETFTLNENNETTKFLKNIMFPPIKEEVIQ